MKTAFSHAEAALDAALAEPFTLGHLRDGERAQARVSGEAHEGGKVAYICPIAVTVTETSRTVSRTPCHAASGTL